MLTYDELRRREWTCARCRSTFAPPRPLSAAARVAAADARRVGRTVEAMRIVREDTGADVAEAKWAALHLRRAPGVCNVCGAAMEHGELVDCARCGALALGL